MPKMYELVDDNVVDQAHRGLDDAPVQADGSDSVTAPPPFLLVRDDDGGHRDAGLRPPRFHPLRQPLRRVTAEPRDEVGSHVGRLQRSRRHGHVEPAAAQLRISGRVAMNLQAIVPAEIPWRTPIVAVRMSGDGSRCVMKGATSWAARPRGPDW